LEVALEEIVQKGLVQLVLPAGRVAVAPETLTTQILSAELWVVTELQGKATRVESGRAPPDLAVVVAVAQELPELMGRPLVFVPQEEQAGLA
jgi:hypothetical protein